MDKPGKEGKEFKIEFKEDYKKGWIEFLWFLTEIENNASKKRKKQRKSKD